MTSQHLDKTARRTAGLGAVVTQPPHFSLPKKRIPPNDFHHFLGSGGHGTLARWDCDLRGHAGFVWVVARRIHLPWRRLMFSHESVEMCQEDPPPPLITFNIVLPILISIAKLKYYSTAPLGLSVVTINPIIGQHRFPHWLGSHNPDKHCFPPVPPHTGHRPGGA